MKSIIRIPVVFIYILIVTIEFASYTRAYSDIVLPIAFLGIAYTLIHFLSDKNNRKVYKQLYFVSYAVYISYAILCYLYMKENNYEYLLVTDTITTYIPDTKDCLDLHSLSKVWDLLYNEGEYNKYQHSGLILIYWTIIGEFSLLCGQDLYFNMQTSVIFLSSFVPVFVYKLLAQHGVKDARKYTYFYTFCSVFAFYSTLILRDAPIAMLYAMAFAYVESPNNLRKILVFGIAIPLVYLTRPEMGLFLFLVLALAYFPGNNLTTSKKAAGFLLFVVISLIIIHFIQELNFWEEWDHNIEYSDSMIENNEDATLNIFDVFPFGLSHLLKVIYIHLSPIPSWRNIKLFESSDAVHNIMQLPRTWAVLYNYIIGAFILCGMFVSNVSKYTRKEVMLFLVALLFLALQVSSTEQRRLMICYPVLLLWAIISCKHMKRNTVKNVKILGITFFIVMQLIGLVL